MCQHEYDSSYVSNCLGNGVLLNTLSPVAVTDKLRVVGIPNDSMPSLMTYSLIIGPSAADHHHYANKVYGPILS